MVRYHTSSLDVAQVFECHSTKNCSLKTIYLTWRYGHNHDPQFCKALLVPVPQHSNILRSLCIPKSKLQENRGQILHITVAIIEA